jgi:hypothetical protein
MAMVLPVKIKQEREAKDMKMKKTTVLFQKRKNEEREWLWEEKTFQEIWIYRKSSLAAVGICLLLREKLCREIHMNVLELFGMWLVMLISIKKDISS